MSDFFADKTILLTGGTGSFGRKFVQAMIRDYKAKKVIVYSRDELKQHEMRCDGLDGPQLRYFIGDVRDFARLKRAMKGVDIVVHAAALKQVPSCEYNPQEAILTNVVGTRNVVDAVLDSTVSRAIMLSTDKAVNPANLYGATKLCAEKLFIHSNSYAGSKGPVFSCVRYGNVVGSRGSVIPLFLEQRKQKKIKITDPRMTRFWITLAQGVDLVANCLTNMQGAEIFVPRISAVTVDALAKLIAPECEIEYVGIRPGEKLHESLLGVDESRHTLYNDDLYVVHLPEKKYTNSRIPNLKKLETELCFSSDTAPTLSEEKLQEYIRECVDSVQPEVKLAG